MAKMKSNTEVTGSMTALVTPFCDAEIAWGRLFKLVDMQVEAGTDWLVPCGTTGESPTLTHEEQDRVVEAVIEQAGGRVPIMAGTGSNCTAEAVRRTKHAAKAGAKAALVVAPYYNRPTQEGLYRHFAAIADSVDIPIVLYNVPFRTGVSIDNDTVVRLRESHPNVVAIKHATGNVDGVTDLLSRCDITVLSGDDSLTLPLMELGAKGVISVIANLCPDWMKSLVDAATQGKAAQARRWQDSVCALADGLGNFGPNPIPIKTAMAIHGLIDEEFRLPLCAMEPAQKTELESLLTRLKITRTIPV